MKVWILLVHRNKCFTQRWISIWVYILLYRKILRKVSASRYIGRHFYSPIQRLSVVCHCLSVNFSGSESCGHALRSLMSIPTSIQYNKSLTPLFRLAGCTFKILIFGPSNNSKILHNVILMFEGHVNDYFSDSYLIEDNTGWCIFIATM